MYDSGESENYFLEPNASNFVSWLRFVSQEYQDRFLNLIEALKQREPEFVSFRFVSVGEDVKSLRLIYGEDKIEYHFGELSDGQRCLILLEALASFLEYTSLFIDEPECYLALPEIQPWLLKIQDRCHDAKLQALIISHHPEYIDFLAADCGIWFERSINGPARVRRLSNEADGSGLPLSELVARGWLSG